MLNILKNHSSIRVLSGSFSLQAIKILRTEYLSNLKHTTEKISDFHISPHCSEFCLLLKKIGFLLYKIQDWHVRFTFYSAIQPVDDALQC